MFKVRKADRESTEQQWLFGDWPSLQYLSISELDKQEDKHELALMVAVAHFQLGEVEKGKKYLQQAQQWGADHELVAKLVLSGIHNSLGRAALLADQHVTAVGHFRHSITLGRPEADNRLITPIRIAHQAMQLGIPLELIDNWNLIMSRYQQQFGTVLQDASNIEASDSTSLSLSLMKKLDILVQKMVTEGEEMMLDGVFVFHERDPFLPGKVAMGLAYWVMEYPPGSPVTINRCHSFRYITSMLLDKTVASWGIDFYLRALHKLNQAGLLERCVSLETLIRLQHKLDWRDFVDERDYSLKRKPNNFLGVAYSIAYHRYQLGWDKPAAAEHLLENIIEHYQASAGEFGFADETEGHGRYDRYSLLLIAEIAHHHLDAGLPLTEEMRKWLRASAEVVLVNLNEGGNGFQYGRSIGAYGDTAFIEILTAAASFGLLNGDEPRMAYHFCCLSTEKFLRFWWDSKRQCVNLWEEGRATEAYRGKFRVLGESLSLLHQHLYSQHIWEQLGFTDENREPQAFRHWLKGLPSTTLTWFEKSEYEYALLTYRDGERIFNVPLINAHEYHGLSTYLPIPYSHNLIQGVPDVALPLLVPTLHLNNGQQLAPLCWYQQIECQHEVGETVLQWRQPLLATLGNDIPGKSTAFQVLVRITFSTGVICCDYTFYLQDAAKVNCVEMDWLSTTKNTSLPSVKAELISGMPHSQVEDSEKKEVLKFHSDVIDDQLSLPESPVVSHIRYMCCDQELSNQFSIKWKLDYGQAMA